MLSEDAAQVVGVRVSRGYNIANAEDQRQGIFELPRLNRDTSTVEAAGIVKGGVKVSVFVGVRFVPFTRAADTIAERLPALCPAAPRIRTHP